jgi:hypothetical protein
MGDPLLARSRRMPRGFQYRFLRPLVRAGAGDARLKLFSLFNPKAYRDMLNADVRPPVTERLGYGKPKRVQRRKNVVEFLSVIG